MPTGYTDGVQDGTVKTLKEYALICARAFGATITMRDAPLDIAIPEKFEQSEYYSKKITELEKVLIWLHGLSKDEAEIEAKKRYRKAVKNYKERQKYKAQQHSRYRKMLLKTQGWKPPDEYSNLKDFMLDQLNMSIKGDISYRDSLPHKLIVVPMSGEAWLAHEMKKAKDNLEYYKEEHTKENDRVNMRNQWLTGLRASLEKYR